VAVFTGVKTFCFRYQRNGKPVRIMIGRYPAISLRVAYETHADLLKKLYRGEEVRNPAAPGIRGIGVAAEPAEPALTVADRANASTPARPSSPSRPTSSGTGAAAPPQASPVGKGYCSLIVSWIATPR
jgi:hypothetical protein